MITAQVMSPIAFDSINVGAAVLEVSATTVETLLDLFGGIKPIPKSAAAETTANAEYSPQQAAEFVARRARLRKIYERFQAAAQNYKEAVEVMQSTRERILVGNDSDVVACSQLRVAVVQILAAFDGIISVHKDFVAEAKEIVRLIEPLSVRFPKPFHVLATSLSAVDDEEFDDLRDGVVEILHTVDLARKDAIKTARATFNPKASLDRIFSENKDLLGALAAS